MYIVSERAKELDAYIKGLTPLPSRPVVIGGKVQALPVWEIPTEMLRYNIRNGRFKAELLQLQADLGRDLDPLNKEDAKEIRKLLLEQDEEQTRWLAENLETVGQLDPGIVTHDGFVINGNRRMAVFDFLHKTKGTAKFEKMQVQRLPKNVDGKDLWRIEAGLQLSKDTRLTYGPVNDLLKIREGVEAKLSPREIAATLYGTKEEEITAKLATLKLIDSYLSYIKRPNSYREVDRKVEHFLSFQNYVLKKMHKAGLKARDIQQVTLRVFALINEGAAHMDIRKVGDVVVDPVLRANFLEQTTAAQKPEPKKDPPPPSRPVGGAASPGPAKTPSSRPPPRDEDEEEEDEEAGGVRDALNDSLEKLKLKKEKEKPTKLLQRALDALSLVTPTNPELKEPANQRLIKKLAATIKRLAPKSK